MNIRNATIEDFEYLLKLQLQLEDIEIKFDNNLKERCYDTNQGREKLKNRINNTNNIFLVVTNESNIVIAFIDGNIPDDEWWYKDTVAYLNHICVDKDYRNHGIASMLLKKFEQTAIEKAATYIRLLAFNQNEPAISFYKNKGFIEYSTYYNKRII